MFTNIVVTTMWDISRRYRTPLSTVVD